MGKPMSTLLAHLPRPSPEKNGWPWTVESDPLPPAMPDGKPWPKISIVTPSYNQGQFIEETIRSVLLQNYPNLEYIIMDGGSTDNSLEIIKKYEPWLAYWVSEKDGGQVDAINKGCKVSNGDLIGWQNSDDYYLPNSFYSLGENFVLGVNADVYHGVSMYIDESGREIRKLSVGKDYSLDEFANDFPLLEFGNHSMLFRAALFPEKVLISNDYRMAFDVDFLISCALNRFKFKYVNGLQGIWRQHDDIRSIKEVSTTQIEMLSIYQSLLIRTRNNRVLYNAVKRNFSKYLTYLYREADASIYIEAFTKYLKSCGYFSPGIKPYLRYFVTYKNARVG